MRILLSALSRNLADTSIGVVSLNQSTSYVMEATEESVGKGRVSPIYSSGCKGVLFSHKFLGVLLIVQRR